MSLHPSRAARIDAQENPDTIIKELGKECKKLDHAITFRQ
jgi:hypothetical protein